MLRTYLRVVLAANPQLRRIALLTKPRHTRLYEQAGFHSLGVSPVSHGSGASLRSNPPSLSLSLSLASILSSPLFFVQRCGWRCSGSLSRPTTSTR